MPNTNIRAVCRFTGLAAAALLFGAAGTAATPRTFGPEFAGSSTCQTCHEDIFNALLKSPHSAVETGKKKDWKEHACESCHGGGAKHAESVSATDITRPSDKTCLSCHLNQPTQAGRIQSTHAKNAVSCSGCHKVHESGGAALVARKPAAVNAQCEGCHITVKAQFDKPFRHKVPENAMTCVDCHNPHGTARTAMAKSFAANEPGCIGCHSDKRGPFTFEHGPVRFDGCATCHEPHGSTNPRMLARAEVRQVCLECHANLPGQKAATPVMGVVPPAFHDLRSPRYQNCTVCHQKVHGSFVDRNLLR